MASLYYHVTVNIGVYVCIGSKISDQTVVCIIMSLTVVHWRM